MTSTQTNFNAGSRFFTVATAGHVDHGKTSLIKALTGIDPDRLKEEKERQMTTDLGFAHLQLPGDLVVGFVDVPGHGKFLKNMLAGVGGIDLALLVVAADEGPMPQTVQHVRILSLLGISKAVVALTKIDALQDTEMVPLLKDSIAELLDAHAITMLDLVAVSSTKNIGLDDLKTKIADHLSALPVRSSEGGAFLPVDRVFSKAGFGTVITGTLVRGRLAVGDQIELGPGVTSGRVRRLETFGRTVEVASAGQRVACNLVLKENKEIIRGHILLGSAVPPTRAIMARLIDRPRVAGESFAKKVTDQPVRLYHGTAEFHGFVRWADPIGEEDGSQSQLVVLLALNDLAAVMARDQFLIRLSDDTIYGGVAIVSGKPRWMKRADAGKLGSILLKEDIESAILFFVGASPHGVTRQAQLALFVPSALLPKYLENLFQSKRLTALGDLLMSPGTRSALAKALQSGLSKLIQEQGEGASLGEGVPLEAVRSAMSVKLERAAFLMLIDEESALGHVVRRKDKLDLPSAQSSQPVPGASSELERKIASALEANLCLDLKELATACGADINKVKIAVQQMSKTGSAHLINYEFAISDKRLREAHAVLASIWQQKRNIAPTDFKEALKTTRKYAMALLQHFDDNKITRRLESGRVLLKAPPQA